MSPDMKPPYSWLQHRCSSEEGLQLGNVGGKCYPKSPLLLLLEPPSHQRRVSNKQKDSSKNKNAERQQQRHPDAVLRTGLDWVFPSTKKRLQECLVWNVPIPSKEVRIQAILEYRELTRKYSVVGELGKGGGGVVYSGIRRIDGASIAIKIISREDVRKWSVIGTNVVPMEVKIHSIAQQNNKGVIRLLECFEIGGNFVMILERPSNSVDLERYLNKYGAMPQAQVKSTFLQITETLIKLHSAKIVHKDVKLENILIDLLTGEVKLIDFGASDFLKDFDESTIDFGTLCYWPPEYFTSKKYTGRELDTWALGVVFYAMVEKRLPFRDAEHIKCCHLQFWNAEHESFYLCRDLMSKMMEVNRTKRYTLLQIYNHPWLRWQPYPTYFRGYQSCLNYPVWSNGVGNVATARHYACCS